MEIVVEIWPVSCYLTAQSYYMLLETLDKLSGFNVRFRLWALLSEVNPSLANCREVTKSNNITECLKILDIVVNERSTSDSFWQLCYVMVSTLLLRWSSVADSGRGEGDCIDFMFLGSPYPSAGSSTGP